MGVGGRNPGSTTVQSDLVGTYGRKIQIPVSAIPGMMTGASRNDRGVARPWAVSDPFSTPKDDSFAPSCFCLVHLCCQVPCPIAKGHGFQPARIIYLS